MIQTEAETVPGKLGVITASLSVRLEGEWDLVYGLLGPTCSTGHTPGQIGALASEGQVC